jgi:hypothetical protein
MTTDFAALATARELRAAMTAVSRQPDLVEPSCLGRTVIELVKGGVVCCC